MATANHSWLYNKYISHSVSFIIRHLTSVAIVMSFNVLAVHVATYVATQFSIPYGTKIVHGILFYGFTVRFHSWMEIY